MDSSNSCLEEFSHYSLFRKFSLKKKKKNIILNKFLRVCEKEDYDDCKVKVSECGELKI